MMNSVKWGRRTEMASFDDMGDKTLLEYYTELVQWHTRREYARDTDPKTDAQRSAFWAAEKELLRRLGEGDPITDAKPE